MNVDEIRKWREEFERLENCRTPDDVYDHAETEDVRELYTYIAALLDEVDRLGNALEAGCWEERSELMAGSMSACLCPVAETAESNLSRLLCELAAFAGGLDVVNETGIAKELRSIFNSYRTTADEQERGE